MVLVMNVAEMREMFVVYIMYSPKVSSETPTDQHPATSLWSYDISRDDAR